MDVRCEKCQTEYELDEAKVTEAGVTVKCTSCGNLFKIKRRGASSAGPSPSIPSPGDTAGDRLWLIRSPKGEIQRFRELTTLQQWIVEQKVTRECEISRTGETWKRLGEITELASFFMIVEQAQASARAALGKEAPRKNTSPMGGPMIQPARPPTPQPAPAGAFGQPVFGQTPPAITATPAAFGDPTRKLPAHSNPPDPSPAAWPGAAPEAVKRPEASPPPKVPISGPSTPTIRSMPEPSSEPSGPTGGLTAGTADEPAWAASKPRVEAPPSRSAAWTAATPGTLDLDDDIDGYKPPKGKLGWILLGLIVLAGAGVAVYFFVLRKPSGPATAQTPQQPAPQQPQLPVDQPVVTRKPPDAGPPPIVESETARVYREGLARLYDDTDEAFAAAEPLLEKARAADPEQDARVLGALSLLNTVAAEYMLSGAEALPSKERRKARDAATARIAKAEKLAKEAFAKAPKAPEALIAIADVRRLQKKKTAEVEKILGATDHPEASYVRALARLRDGKSEDAKVELETAAQKHQALAGRDHLRARYYLARIALADKRWADARAELDKILLVQPDHARAHALQAEVAKQEGLAKPIASADPTPDPAGDPVAVGPVGPVTADQYDGLVQKADALAENGNCGGAMKLYEKALDARAGGVEALVGMGYCYMDGKDYGRAVSHFRAALGISPRFGDALWGIAEAYRFQGKGADAVAYYQKYLDANPSGAKAAAAKRFVNDLGGGDKPPEPTPDKPPEPTPDKPPDGEKPVDKPPDPPPEKPADPPPAEKIETPPAGP